MRAIYSIVAACCFAALYGCGASSVSPDLPNVHSAGVLRPTDATLKTLYAFHGRLGSPRFPGRGWLKSDGLFMALRATGGTGSET